MRLAELDPNELLEFDPANGLIHFAGERAVLLDAVAFGLLRRELVETIGLTAARGVLTRFGFAHGWRAAQNLRAFPWDTDADWKRAGGRLHSFQGLVDVEPILARPGQPEPFAEAIWHHSYEAEQHLAGYGQSSEPVCWTLIGFASGYLSHCNGKDIYFVEHRCMGQGAAVCQVEGLAREDWGDRINPHLPFFGREGIDTSLDRVADALKRTERRLRSRTQVLRTLAGHEEDVPGLVARSDGMARVVDVARRVARVDSSVLITGESGVGKERIARLIHEESPRAGGPFVAVNCGAVSESLLESELFGHARGAFTGAIADRAGLFEAAQGGTLFLDEVGEVPASMQVKLLRVLQERQVRRVGENRDRDVDVRLVAATNRDLSQEVAEGRFRTDLYYRLKVIEIAIPPLRERKEDVLPLARVVLDEAARRIGRRVSGFSCAAADQFLRHGWPGNVRELQNAIERAVVLSRGNRIEVGDLPEEVRLAQTGQVVAASGQTLAEIEKQAILAALEAQDGNQARTAAQLGIGTATLYRKLKQYREQA